VMGDDVALGFQSARQGLSRLGQPSKCSRKRSLVLGERMHCLDRAGWPFHAPSSPGASNAQGAHYA
jgi:hypothetical protein